MRVEVTPEEITGQDDTIHLMSGDVFTPHLYHNLYVPSYIHGYSLAIEYMRNWFVKSLPDIQFKYIHVNGKHMFDDYKQFNKQNVKREKPLLIITPQVDHEYDREYLDSYLMPNDIYVQKHLNSFFQDRDKNLYLTMAMRLLKVRFTFAARVSTRAEQFDLKEKMNFAFRVGATQGEFRVIDYVISKDIIHNIAHDAGFLLSTHEKVSKDAIYHPDIQYYQYTGTDDMYAPVRLRDKDEFRRYVDKVGLYTVGKPEVADPVGFLSYLNSNSAIPFTFQMRGIKNEPEYYIRMDQVYCRVITKNKLDIDDGEREGMLENNFHVTLEAELELPIPHYFVYHNTSELAYNLPLKEAITSAGFYTIAQVRIPEKNVYGWKPLIDTGYLLDENQEVIDFSQLLDHTRLRKVVDYSLDSGLNPSSYIDFRIYIEEGGEVKPIWNKIDYGTRSIQIHPYNHEQMIYLVYYVDMEFVNKTLDMLEDRGDKNRI